MDEPELIARAAAGDRGAFHALVERYRALVYRLAYQSAGNHPDAEDIAQDVFIKLFRALAGFRHDAQFSSWLYRITLNVCIDHGRRRNVIQARERPDEPLSLAACDRPDPERFAYAAELGRVLHDAVDRLPPRQRVIFVMRHYDELKLTEIASVLRLQEGTVKRQLHAAVRRLRLLLRDAHALPESHS